MYHIFCQERRELGPIQSEFYNNDEQRLGTNDIRVLTLLRGSRGDELTCTLERIALPELHEFSSSDTSRLLQEPHHDFTTLSYLWGNPKRNIQKIKCNNVDFYVTSNLHSALLHLRQPSHDMKLWIDAICINQKDDEEKGKQVQRMGEIYSRSKKTIVWPGPESWMSRTAFRSLSAIATNTTRPDVALSSHQWYQWHGSNLVSGLSVLLKTWSILLFLRRQYFTRVWIIQELALSHHIEIVCGQLSIPWEDLVLGTTVVLSIGIGKRGAGGLGNILVARALLPETPRDGLDDPAWIFHAIMRTRTPKPRNILAMSTMFRQSHATNPVDKVFGLLGLCERIQEGSTYGIQSVYSQDDPGHRDRVYIRIARIILESENGLQLFSAIQRRTPKRVRWWCWLLQKDRLTQDSASNLPTWVPDWSDTAVTATPLSQVLGRNTATSLPENHKQFPTWELHSPDQNRNDFTKNPHQPAVKNTGSASDPDSRYYDTELRIRGCCIDEIVELGAVCDTERTQSSFKFSFMYTFTMSENHRMETFSKWENQFRPYISATTFWNHFILTITCGRINVPEETKVMSLLADFRSRSPANLPTVCGLGFLTLFTLPLIISAMTGSGIWERIILYWVAPAIVISLLFYACFQIFPNFNFPKGWIKYGLDEDFLKEDFDHMELRRMALLKSRVLALVPEASLVGDEVWICGKSSMPVTLRSRGDKFEVVGECYVHLLPVPRVPEKSICLV